MGSFISTIQRLWLSPACAARTWEPIAALRSPLVLMVLNPCSKCNCVESTINLLWNKAVYRACCDGGANILHRLNLFPDQISGDFDSISESTMQFFQTQDVQLINTPDQDLTDFTKAMYLLQKRQETFRSKGAKSIVVLGCLAGRFDQVMGVIETLFLTAHCFDLPTYLVHNESLLTLVPKGKHVIHFDDRTAITGVCGLIPVGNPCIVTTEGLQWNLTNHTLSFGRLVSTSNVIKLLDVTVVTDQPLLFVIELKSIS